MGRDRPRLRTGCVTNFLGIAIRGGQRPIKSRPRCASCSTRVIVADPAPANIGPRSGCDGISARWTADRGQYQHDGQSGGTGGHGARQWRVRRKLDRSQRNARRQQRLEHQGADLQRQRCQGRHRIPGQHTDQLHPDPAGHRLARQWWLRCQLGGLGQRSRDRPHRPQGADLYRDRRQGRRRVHRQHHFHRFAGSAPHRRARQRGLRGELG